jgi:hypothetical protein
MRTRRWLLNMMTAAILAMLGACGGGGDGDGGGGPTIDITATNRDVIAHATVAGMVALNPLAMAPIGAGSSASTGLMSAWPTQLNARLAKAWPQREAPQAVYGPTEVPCDISGSMTVTYDDRDPPNLSVGDSITSVFHACVDVAGETMNGTETMRFTQGSESSFSAQITMTDYSYSSAKHSVTFNGRAVLDFAQQSASLFTARATADGPVTVALSLAHLAYVDTVTLLDGFVVDDTLDTSIGRTLSTGGGLLQSANAGGIVEMTTMADAPITKYAVDAYPRAGVVRVEGKDSTLQMTVLSADQVQLDLDADGNGSFESTETVAWDWLL